MIRPVWPALVVIVGATVGASARQNAMSFERDVNARNMFLAARAAVIRDGGSINKLRSLTAHGRSQFIAADGSKSAGEVEIRVLLPDRYLRIDTAGSERRSFGFNAGALVNAIRDRDRPLETPERAMPALLERARRDFVLFMLGTTTYVTREEPLVFHAIMTGDFTNEPYMLRVGGTRMAFTLSIDPKLRSPRGISYEEGGQDISIAFDDRRTVNGLSLPFHLATTAGRTVVDELTFEQVLVNPPVTAADFNP